MTASRTMVVLLLVGILMHPANAGPKKSTRIAEPTAFKGNPGLVVAKGGQIVRLAGSGAELLSSDLATVTPLAIEGASALAVLCDGAPLVVGAREVWRLDGSTPQKFMKFTPVDPMEGRTRAWSDPSDPRRFWVAHAKFLLHVELPSNEGEKVKELDDVPRAESASFAPLPDGSVQWHSKTRLADTFVHLVAGAKDRLWASHVGKIVAVDGAGKTHATIKTNGVVVALAATDRYTAALIATKAAKPAWTLLVVDASGREILREATPFQPSPVDGGTLEIAIGRFDPIVAVGDAKRMASWNLTTKQRVGAK
jgi:hypothetical protein